jgi:ribosomal protein L7/L12
MTNFIPEDELASIRASLAAGKKIEAIKLYRQTTGAGLAEAKRAVEALEAGYPVGGRTLDSASHEDIEQIQAAVFAGEKIKAIKLHRAATGVGLKDAKDFIEALEAELRRTQPTHFTKPAAKGCGASTLALVLAVAAAAVVLFL